MTSAVQPFISKRKCKYLEQEQENEETKRLNKFNHWCPSFNVNFPASSNANAFSRVVRLDACAASGPVISPLYIASANPVSICAAVNVRCSGQTITKDSSMSEPTFAFEEPQR